MKIKWLDWELHPMMDSWIGFWIADLTIRGRSLAFSIPCVVSTKDPPESFEQAKHFGLEAIKDEIEQAMKGK